VPVAFNHVGIAVSEMEAAISFYELLGFERAEPQNLRIVDQEWMPRIVGFAPADIEVSIMRMGPINIELIEYLDPKGEGRATTDVNDVGDAHIGLEVADVYAEHDRLAAAGVRFRNPPLTIPDEVPGFGGVQVVYGYDPDGNTFEMQTFPWTEL
jgi:catechol 2,3-dioxygenase-like lactoylglutathione lyase family enzyme